MSPTQTTALDHTSEATESIDFLNEALRIRAWSTAKFWAEEVIKEMEAVKETISE